MHDITAVCGGNHADGSPVLARELRTKSLLSSATTEETGFFIGVGDAEKIQIGPY